MSNRNLISSATMPKLLTPSEAAELLGLDNYRTLAVWRCVRRYDLPFVKVGRKVMYRVDDVMSFIDRRTIRQSGRAQAQP